MEGSDVVATWPALWHKLVWRAEDGGIAAEAPGLEGIALVCALVDRASSTHLRPYNGPTGNCVTQQVEGLVTLLQMGDDAFEKAGDRGIQAKS